MNAKRIAFILLVFLIAGIFHFPAESFNFSLDESHYQDINWSITAECNVPILLRQVVVRNRPPSTHLIFVFLEEKYCSLENFKKIFLCLSEKYPQPENLVITLRSDKASLQRWIDHFFALHLIHPTDSLEDEKNRPIDLSEELKNEVGYYRADYSRTELVEELSYSFDPNKKDMDSVTLKRRAGIGPSGNFTFFSTESLSLDLVLAAQLGLESRVKELIKNGANVNARTKYGNTPLLVSILNGHSKITNILLDAGADCNQKDPDGWTPLMYALVYNYRGKGIAEELMRRGADLNTKAKNGDTALLLAIITSEGMTHLIEQLLDKGADLNVKDRFGRTPLQIAEGLAHGDSVRELLQKAITRKR